MRNDLFYPEFELVEISISSPSGGESINEAAQVPNRSPMEIRELNNTGELVVVFDPNTGLEWLKLTEGEFFTLQEIQNETDAGGLFEGFELAGSTDVETLILNFIHASGLQLVEQTMYTMLDDETESG